MFNINGYCRNQIYLDLQGNPVQRPKDRYPYSYEPFVTWKNDCQQTDSTIYSDRLYQWDAEKYNKCRKEVCGDESQYFYGCSPDDVEKFLQLYLNEEITLTAIMEGCNYSSGFPFWVFYYRHQ